MFLMLGETVLQIVIGSAATEQAGAGGGGLWSADRRIALLAATRQLPEHAINAALCRRRRAAMHTALGTPSAPALHTHDGGGARDGDLRTAR